MSTSTKSAQSAAVTQDDHVSAFDVEADHETAACRPKSLLVDEDEIIRDGLAGRAVAYYLLVAVVITIVGLGALIFLFLMR